MQGLKYDGALSIMDSMHSVLVLSMESPHMFIAMSYHVHVNLICYDGDPVPLDDSEDVQ